MTLAEGSTCVLTVVGTSYKLKTEACKKGSAKELNLRNIAVNYLSVLIFISLHIQGGTDYLGI